MTKTLSGNRELMLQIGEPQSPQKLNIISLPESDLRRCSFTLPAISKSTRLTTYHGRLPLPEIC
jgi:hypothetical protein